MNKNVVDVKIADYFPWTMVALGAFMLIIGFIVVFQTFIVGLCFLVIGFFMVTTHYRLNINSKKKTYREYLWVMGYKKGTRKTYQELDYIYIQKNVERQTMHLRAVTTTIEKEIFDSFLKLSDQRNIHLKSDEDRRRLLHNIRPIANKLELEIYDYTGEEARVV
jgi:hypothetical protein